MAVTVDVDGDDFAVRPWDYPGAAPATSGLLAGGCYRRMSVQPGRRLGQALVEGTARDGADRLNVALLLNNVAQIDARHVVVAVGSNASAAVMRRKFANRGVSTVIPFVNVELVGVGVAHSAHVSIPGYVAATPFLAPDRTLALVAALLDPDQLACLDKTEPNYLRRAVDADRVRLMLEGGERPESFWIYESKWGVLTGVDGRPVELRKQRDLFSLLTAQLDGFLDLVGGGDPETTMKRLAENPSLRDDVRKLFAEAGWSRPASIGEQRDRVTYGETASVWEDEPASPEALTCLPSNDALERRGEQCVTLHPQDIQALGMAAHASVRADREPMLAPVVARIVPSPQQPLGTAGVDQVVRNAIGVEVQEPVRLRAASVPGTPVADRILAHPHYCMVRVLAAPEDVLVRRRELSGGSLASRFPSAAESLGIHPDLPWIFLDSAVRRTLGVSDTKLGAVRIRASRRFQVYREIRELLLLLVLAFVGLASIIQSTPALLVVLAGVLAAAIFVMRHRLKQRLEGDRWARGGTRGRSGV